MYLFTRANKLTPFAKFRFPPKGLNNSGSLVRPGAQWKAIGLTPVRMVQPVRGLVRGDAGSGSRLDRFMRKFRVHPDSIVVKGAVNRYLFVPVAMLNHMCLGSIFAWSILNEPLTRIHGVIVPAPSDWLFTDITLVFSLVMSGFVWGALISKFIDKAGPRFSCLVGATCTGLGLWIAAAAVSGSANLYLLYFGGFVWGLAHAWSYVPPVTVLMRWFPDRRGFAAGSCIVGYGAGGSIAAALFDKLLRTFRVAPEYVGRVDEVTLINEHGKLFCTVMDQLREVVVASAADAKGWGLHEGIYLAGTGSTGIVETLLISGLFYSTVMGLSALAYRVPCPVTPPPQLVPNEQHLRLDLDHGDIDVATATRSWQFSVVWVAFCLSTVGSYGILSAGKTMLMDTFSSTAPEIITGSFAAAFVMAMGFFNLAGRFFWSVASDSLAHRTGNNFYGRKLTYALMWGLGAPLYFLIVWSIHTPLGTSHPILPLAIFSISVFGILSSFGGAAATRPALCGDLFGPKIVGVMTARQLSVVLPGAYIGPKIVGYLREKSIDEAIVSLTSQVDEATFVHAFSAGKEDLSVLIENKVVTINRLLELFPPETMDPTPFVYDQTMYVMAALQMCAFLLNLTVRPIQAKPKAIPASTDPTAGSSKEES